MGAKLQNSQIPRVGPRLVFNQTIFRVKKTDINISNSRFSSSKLHSILIQYYYGSTTNHGSFSRGQGASTRRGVCRMHARISGGGSCSDLCAPCEPRQALPISTKARIRHAYVACDGTVLGIQRSEAKEGRKHGKTGKFDGWAGSLEIWEFGERWAKSQLWAIAAARWGLECQDEADLPLVNFAKEWSRNWRNRWFRTRPRR